MSAEKLFTPLKVGAVTAPNRVFMAPLTRLRSIEPGDIPTPLMGEYYRQRASSGLIITEATQISAQAKGYAGAPGLHSPEQIAAWQKITAGVHAEEGRHRVGAVADHGHARNILNFIDALLGKAEPCYQPQQGVDMIRILTAIYESARTGAEVRL